MLPCGYVGFLKYLTLSFLKLYYKFLLSSHGTLIKDCYYPFLIYKDSLIHIKAVFACNFLINFDYDTVFSFLKTFLYSSHYYVMCTRCHLLITLYNSVLVINICLFKGRYIIGFFNFILFFHFIIVYITDVINIKSSLLINFLCFFTFFAFVYILYFRGYF